MLSARSRDKFPTLGPSSCPWHKGCTPMDCEFFRSIPEFPQYERPGVREEAVSFPASVADTSKKSVPVKPSKSRRR